MPTTLILDDFTGTSLDPAWSRHGGVTTTQETWNNPGLTVTNLAQNEGYLRSAPSGDFTVELDMTLTDTAHMMGPVILDDNGNGIGATWYTNPAAALVISVSNYSYGGSFAQVGTTQSAGRLRITKAGTTYTVAYSADNGATWTAETSALTWTGTPTQIGALATYLTQGSVKLIEFKVAQTPTTTTVSPPAATATAATPVVTVAADAVVAAVAAGATASATAPSVSTVPLAVTVTAPAAQATASAPVPQVSLLAQTDTTNRLNGRIRGGYGLATYDPGVAATPSTLVLGKRVDKAIPLPTPDLVNGRPT